MSYNTAFIAVSILKIITSASVLLFAMNTCNKPIHEFLIYMIVHDFLYCVVLFLKLVLALSAYDLEDDLQRRDIEARHPDSTRHSHHIEASGRPNAPQGEYNLYHNLDNNRINAFERKTRLLTALSMLVNM